MLYIDGNVITAIIKALQENNCLVTLHMYNNPMSNEAIVGVVNGLKVNNTLISLGLPTDNKKIISSLQQDTNTEREYQGCQVKLMIFY